MYLLDTNILSELRKRSRCNPSVAKWIEPLQPSDLFVSVLVLGEIRKGIELLKKRDRIASEQLEGWLKGLYKHYAERIINVTPEISEE